jgi:hypothetical protein
VAWSPEAETIISDALKSFWEVAAVAESSNLSVDMKGKIKRSAIIRTTEQIKAANGAKNG